MIDATTHKPLRVSTDGSAGPYIMVPVSQLTVICGLLDENGIRYQVEEEVISLNGAPEVAVVNLGRGADVAEIQSLLDSVR